MTDSVRIANATTPSRRARMQPRVLEARVLLDAAAVETAVAVAADASVEPTPVLDNSVLFDAPATAGRREAYVVDTAVEGYQGLLSAVPAGAEIFLIDGSRSGLAQLNEALDSVDGQFDAIHVISHGAGGTLRLGADTITASNVASFQEALNSLGEHIAEDGDLLLYGCDIAGNAEGTQLLASLVSLTGADVAASTDATGGPNGDADLETWAGNDGIQADPWAAVAGLESPLALEGYYAGREEGYPFGVVAGANLGWATDSGRDTSGKDWIASSGLGERQVRLWSMNGTTRENDQFLEVPSGATNEFGRAIAIDGDVLVVADRDAGSYGYLYVYTRNTSTNVWALARTIDVGTAAGINGRIGHTGLTNVGNQWLAVSGNRIAVGAPTEGGNTGQVAWFATTTNWGNGTIVSNTFNEPGGYASDTDPYFGSSVAIAGDALFVGAAGADANGNDGTFGWGDTGWHGAVFAYTWTASTPTTGLSTTVAATFNEADDGGNTTNTYMGGAVDAYWDGTNYTVVIGSAGSGGNDGDVRLYRAATLTALDSAAVVKISGRTTALESDKFGLSVAIAGNRIVVGAPDHGQATDAAVFSYSLATFTQAAIVGSETNWTPSGAYSGGVAGDDLGRSVTITQAGVIAVGAPDRGANTQGAVVLFDNASDTSGSVIQATVSADRLGYAVDASGEWVVAGGSGNGAVEVWRVVGEQRIEQRISLPSGATSSFGQAVSIDGNTFVVGDPNAGTAGRVYVYQLNTTTSQWALVQSLDVASISGWGTARIGGWADANLGGNQWLAVSENRIAVGAPNEGGNTGRVAWFADTSNGGDVGNWSTFASSYFDEPAPASYGSDGQTAPRFGASVAIAQDALVVGAPTADTEMSGGAYSSTRNGQNHGAVFVFQWSRGSVGAPTTATGFLLSGEADTDGIGTGSALAAENSSFGSAVDVDYYNPTPNDPSAARYTIVVGAPGENGGRGEVYIYQTTSNSLTAFAAASNIYGQTTDGGIDRYGLAVAVSQGRIVVGAPNHDADTDNAVFFYERANNVWTSLNTNNPGAYGVNVQTFTAASYGGTGGDRFGRGVAFSNGNNIAAGAPLYASDDRGAVAFFFARTPVAVNDTYFISEDSGVTTFTPTGKTGSNDLFGTETDATVTVTPELPSSIKGTLVWNADSNTFTFDPNGQFEFLSDGQSEVITLRYTLTTTTGGYTFISYATVTLTVQGVNDVPIVDAGIPGITVPRQNEPNGNPSAVPTASVGSVVLPFNAFNDVDQIDVLTYSLISVTKVSGNVSLPANLPGGKITVGGNYNNATGVNTGLISYDLSGLGTDYQDSVWQVTVRASDGKGGTVDTTFNFTIARDNQNPETQTIPAMTATEDSVFVYDFEADDNVNSWNANLPLIPSGYFRDPDTTSEPYAERLTYSIVSQSGPGPDWLSISPDGVLTGAPSNENVGVHTVKLKVTDIFGNSIESNAFTITVGNTNDAPVLVNDIDRKVSIKGETFSFNVKSGALAWGGGGAPSDDLAPPPYGDPNNFFYDIDNSTVDGRSPNSGDVITYRAFNAVDGTEITSLGSGGTAGGTNDVSWLAFDGTSFTGTSAGVLGSTITIRLRATDNHGAFTETEFEIGIFPRDGAGVESGAVPTPEYAAQVGYDVAINSGTTPTGQGMAGKWAVVGAPGANAGRGYIYIYENTAASNSVTPVWTYRDQFTTTAAYARLGTSVDISADGLRIVAGAPNEDTNGATAGSLQGAVYFFQNNGSGVWTAAATPKATASVADANIGMAVALNQDGSRVLVGAPMDDEAGTNAGAAYVFNFGVATASNKLLPTSDSADSRAGDLFGSSVAYDQNVLVIGAPRDDHSGKVDAGSVYVVSADNPLSTSTGQFVKLKKSALSVGNYDYFGSSVDVDVFSGVDGATDSVGIVVGTPKDDVAGADAGAVYVFYSGTMITDHTNGGGLTSIAQLGTAIKAYDAVDLQEFGTSVALDVDELTGDIRMAVGSSLNAASSGAAYAYRYWGASGWIGQRYLPATSAVKFGYAVDVAASVFIVGAPDSDRTQSESGKYYSFNSKVLTSGQTPIEALSSAAPIAKTADSGQPAPVILSARSSIVPGTGQGKAEPFLYASLLGDDRDEEWMRLLRPVSDWSRSDAVPAFMAAANSVLSPVVSYAEAVLFDQRTRVDEQVLQVAASAEKEQDAPGNEMPATEGESVPPSAEVPLAALLQGFSTQLEAANDARAREARQLLVALGSLAG